MLQAKLYDFSARFNEAAQRYHELSFDASIDEEDRGHMLYVGSSACVCPAVGAGLGKVIS